jgi:hypothetical protein
MAVVDKIESLGFEVEIALNNCLIKKCQYRYYEFISQTTGESKIDATYNAIVEFIKWYKNIN